MLKLSRPLDFLIGKRIALQFSGGKDSLACLYLLMDFWPVLTVLWGNPGDEFPETVAQMRAIAPLVARFIEVRGNAREEHALPVDLLPSRASYFGMASEPEGAKTQLQSGHECCFRNFWLPMAQRVAQLGIQILIRGQRSSEFLRAPVTDGSAQGAAEIYLPIEHWSQDDVLEYLQSQGVALPVFYEYMSAGPKCMRCTAWLPDQKGKLSYLREFHPQVAKEYERRMELVDAEITHASAIAAAAMQEVRGEAKRNKIQ